MNWKKNLPPQISFSTLVLSMGGVGFSPLAPGTMGSIVSLPLLYLWGLVSIPKIVTIVALIFLISIISFMTERVQKKLNLKDPQWIVIDEMLGMMVTFAFVPQIDFWNLLLCLVFFRFFDIIKFWPASYFDKMNHGAGTILDDVISGVYAGILLLIVNILFALR